MEEAFVVVWNGHKFTGWPARIGVFALCLVPWMLGVALIVMFAVGQARIVW